MNTKHLFTQYKADLYLKPYQLGYFSTKPNLCHCATRMAYTQEYKPEFLGLFFLKDTTAHTFNSILAQGAEWLEAPSHNMLACTETTESSITQIYCGLKFYRPELFLRCMNNVSTLDLPN